MFSVPLVTILTPVLLFAAAAWMVMVRRQCRIVALAMHRAVDGDGPRADEGAAVPQSAAVLRGVARAANRLVEQTSVRLAQAEEHARELEIQLKISMAERQEAQAILHSISDAVIVTDPFDELVMANESAAKVFSFDSAKAIGEGIDRAIKDAKVIEMIRDMRQSRSASGRRIVEHSMRSPDGGAEEERTFKITLSCVGSAADHPAGVVAVLHDMTQERKVAKEKNEFVSSVAHELRTPLASIKAYVEMLIDGEAEDEKTKLEFQEVIQGEANRLARLIDNILSISRIESGVVQVNKQPGSLTVVLKEAIEVITPQARNKRITVVEKLTPVFYQTMADKDMLYQAVLNLMSNAVKYTPEGGTVTIETNVDEAAGKVITYVRDTGVGIVPKDMPKVFDKFFRSEANNHMAKGTGLGLALVKHIIETVHKGRLFLESEVGKGSSFGFELELSE